MVHKHDGSVRISVLTSRFETYSREKNGVKERQNDIHCLTFLKKGNDLFGTHAI